MDILKYVFIIVTIMTVTIFSADISNAFASGSGNVIVNEQTQITLNGLESADPDGDQLTYSWQQTGGDPVQISDTTSPVISFMTPAVPPGQIKVLTFSLNVNDGHGAYDQSVINVEVQHVNHQPIVVMGNDITVYEGQQVTISGTATDPDNDPLTYSWGQYAGPMVTLPSTSGPTITFTAPIISPKSNEKLLFLLEANDGQGGIGRGQIKVTVLSNIQQSPTFSCTDINANEGDTVTLNPAITNPSNISLPYSTWSQLTGPQVILSGSPSNPSFTVPTIFDDDFTAMNNNPDKMTFMLFVNDGITMLPTCKLTVNIQHPSNSGQPPIADAGQDKTVDNNELVMLDGSASKGDNITYSWQQTGGEPVTLTATHSSHPSFVAPDVAIGQTKILTFQLTVSNEFGQSNASVTITVEHSNLPPTAKIIVQ